MSGKREDKHFRRVIETLAVRGLALATCRYVGDEPERIVDALRTSRSEADIVFCFGGIGATPDDYTRASAARAFDRPLERHPGAAAEIEARFGAEAYPKRILMADLPEGCELIPNPVNRVPGFSVGHHHFLPGFPQMAWPMMEWVLDHRYPELRAVAPMELAIVIPDAAESALIDTMNEFLARYPELKLSSLPHLGEGERHVELGVRGAPDAVPAAMQWLKNAVTALGFKFSDARGGQ